MNPITETRYSLVRYVVLYTLFAAGYAAAFASVSGGAPAGEWWTVALDGAVFGLVSGFEGLILWNVLKYGTAGTPEGAPASNYFRIGRIALTAAAGILFVAVAVGAEAATAAVVLSQTGTFPQFVATIPARSLLIAAVYVCFVLWYSSARRSYSPNADSGRNADSELGYAENPENPEVGNGFSEKSAGQVEPLERITVKGAGGKIEVIDTRDIICLQAEGDYVAIVTASGRRLKEQTMKYFEEALPRGRFVRVHRSCIVSVAHISRIESSGRERSVVLRNNYVIRISDAGYKLLRAVLGL